MNWLELQRRPYPQWLTGTISAVRRERRRAQWRRYSASEPGRARNARYEATLGARERKQTYDVSILGRQRAQRYRDRVNLLWSFDGGKGHRNTRLSSAVEDARSVQHRSDRPIDREAMELLLRVHGLVPPSR
jgi:hypothetical protein